MLVLFYVFFFFLEGRSIDLECNHCGKHINGNTPWRCGICKQGNERTKTFPFVHRCQHCSDEPKAYKCHHEGCGKLNYLTRDSLAKGFASWIGDDSKSSTPSDPDAPKSESESETPEDIAQRIQKARLQAEFEKQKQQQEDLKNPHAARQRKMTERMDEAQTKREARANIRRQAAQWRKETNENTSLSDEERAEILKEIEKDTEAFLDDYL